LSLRLDITPVTSKLAYLAGLFDGEGSVSIVRNRSTTHDRYQLCVSMHMSDREPLNALVASFGGSVVPATVSKPGRSDTWQWSLWSQKAVPFLTAIQPHLLIERRRVRVALALEFQAQKRAPRGSRTLLPEYRERQRDYFEQMCELNQRGPRREAA
jgi:hypothetical protein